MPVLTGSGLLSGSLPVGIVTVEGAPAVATIRVQLRYPGDPDDGIHVAETTSAADGTWVVAGLNEALAFDVIARFSGYNDVIISNVNPYIGFPRFTEADDTRITDSGDARVSE